MTSKGKAGGTVESSSREGGVTVLRVRGNFGQDVVHEIEGVVAALGAGSPLVINLHDVVYLSSAGIGEIVHLASRFNLALADPPESVVKILGLAEVLSLFDVGASEEEALSLSRQKC